MTMRMPTVRRRCSSKMHVVTTVILLLLSSYSYAFVTGTMSSNRWGPLPLSSTSKLSSASTDQQHHQQHTAAAAMTTTTTTSTDAHLVNGEQQHQQQPQQPSQDTNCIKTADVLSLDSIRSTLIRQEETIIFALIERSQFRHNAIVYKKGGFGSSLGIPPGSISTGDDDLSFMEYMLIGTEVLHSTVRRYTSPEEHAFFPNQLPTPLAPLPQLEYPSLLDDFSANINFNPILMQKYIEEIVPSITLPGDDEQHGSTVIADINVLQALSRRVHYGKFVAESKYRDDPEAYQKLVHDGNADGVMELLTNSKVEEQVLKRARLKAATYGREPLQSLNLEQEDEQTALVAAAAASAVVAAVKALSHNSDNNKVDPAVIEDIYRKIVIPLTKDIEVAYLFRRCGKEPPPEYAPDRMSVDVKKQE